MPAGAFIVTASAKAEDYYTYTVSKGEATITGVDTSISGEVIIPSTLGGYPVTVIGESAFEGCRGITSLTIPEGITSIGDSAFKGCAFINTVNYNAVNCIRTTSCSYPVTPVFEGCARITTVNIGENVKSVPGYTFYGCTGITTLNFNATKCDKMGMPVDSSSISVYPVFTECKNLKTINIGENVTKIPECAFAYMTTITSFVIPDNVTVIGKSAFKDCTALTSVYIPESITKIPSNAFANCSALRSITIPESVTSVGTSAFYGCENLTTVNFNAVNCTEMGSSYYPAFQYCSVLKNVNIGERVTNIPALAFGECKKIESVYIPDSVKTIGESAFSECTGLKSVTGCRGLTGIGGSAFYGCTGLTDIELHDGLTEIGKSAFYGCTGLTSLSLPDSVITVGPSAFYNCSGLTSLRLPDSIITVGDYAFFGCTGLPYSIYGNAEYIGNDENPYLVLLSAVSSDITEIDIHEDTKIICSGAFSGCSGLTDVRIPEGVTDIGKNAFYGCSGLSGIIIPENVVSIGEGAFRNCTGLISVDFNAVECMKAGSVNYPAFEGCSVLKTVNVGDRVTKIPDYGFSKCTKITDVNLGERVTAVGKNAFKDSTAMTAVSIPPSVTEVGSGAFPASSITEVHISDLFAWCETDFADYSANPLNNGAILYLNGEKVTELSVSEDVSEIGDFAFCGYDHLTEVTLGRGVTVVGSSAFSGCGALERVVFENSRAKIEEYAFAGCSALTELDLGDGVTEIGMNAFYNCNGLTEISIPDSVVSIGEKAFYACYSIKSVTLGSGVEDIETYAFSHSEIGSIFIPERVKSIGYQAFDESTAFSVDESNASFAADENGALYNKDMTTLIRVPATFSGFFEVPLSVTAIYGSAFRYCSDMTDISVGSNLTKVGGYAFEGCDNLENVYITDIAAWCNNISFSDYAANPLCCAENLYLNGEIVTDVDLPEGITQIQASVFRRYEKLKSVHIPEGVTAIHNSAFYGCTGLEAITLPKSLTSIGSSAISDCTSLKAVYYYGDETDRTNISFNSYYNKSLVNATWYYSACKGSVTHTYDNGCDAVCNVCGCERYVFGHSVDVPPYIFENSAQYPFTLKDNIYTSTNKASPSVSEARLAVISDGYVLISYYTSTEKDYDKLIIKHNAAEIVTASGTTSWTQKTISVKAGDTVSIAYSKDGSTSSGNDMIRFIIDGKSMAETVPPGCEDAVVCETCGAVIKEAAGHVYSGVCDTECNNCKKVRTAPEHTYDNACDAVCNVCESSRTVPDHVYENECDTDCSECGYIREVGPHYVIGRPAHTLKNCESYPFELSEGFYTSTNKASYSKSTFTVIAAHDCSLVIRYKVSSERSYDKLTISKNDSTLASVSGEVSETGLTVSLSEGDVLTISYSKNGSGSAGADTASFKLEPCSCKVDAEKILADCVNAVVCDGCGATVKPVLDVHAYDNDCDVDCNVCGLVRSVPDHSYTKNGAHTCDICKYSKTPDAPEIESKTNSSVTLVPTEGFEYSLDGEFWQTSNVFADLSADTAYVFYQRVMASADALQSRASEGTKVVFKSAKDAPPAPVIISFTDTAVTLMPNADCEYSLDGISWQRDNVFTGLSPNTGYTFYQRYSETDTHEASDRSGGAWVNTDKSKQTLIPDAPTVQSFTSDSITLTPVEGCEYSMDGTRWQSGNVFYYLSCGTEYTFYQRYKETSKTYVGKSSEALVARTDKGTHYAPYAPTLYSKTFNSVTLVERSGYEYSRDGVNWQTSARFAGLDPETNYIFYQRFAETDTHYASSASSPLIVKTLETSELSDIGILKYPHKVTYLEGKDELDVTGGALTLFYADGTTDTVDVTADMVSGFDNTKVGIQTLTVAYGGLLTAFEVEIIEKSAVSVSVTEKPAKLAYLEGEELDTAGMVVTAYYDNGTSEVIENYTVSGYTSTAGTKTVTVAYEGHSASFTVKVFSGIPSEITSDTYLVEGDNISGIKAGATVSDLLEGINEGFFCKVYKDGSEVEENASVGTGMTLVIHNGDTAVAVYTVSVTGDLDGDGAVGAVDSNLMKRIVAGTLTVDDNESVVRAADVDGDGVIGAVDANLIKRTIAGAR